jgi:molecular chaperone HtpG
MSEASPPETFGFQAEVTQLLHLMVHSLYSDREIFLRELISNASDACDKLRFEALESTGLLDDGSPLEITIAVDKEAGEIVLADNGIGMSRDEIIEQLGTIAHSGTSRFIDSLSGDKQKDSQLIGQFGVGFYSAFIVAELVTVESRRADLDAANAVRWQSSGQGEYTLTGIERPRRGTTVTLKLKQDASEFLEAHRVRSLIRKYSDHIAFPIRLEIKGEDANEEPVNRAKALWTRPRSEIEDAEYIEFYRHVTHDFTDPLCWSHNHVEGKREYTSLLYVPTVAPFDLWNREAPRGVKLYVQRVFITDQAEEFLPLYLRFIRGIVDSKDLSLNVSRELLQRDPNIAAIRTALTKRVLDMLGKLARDDGENYGKFWTQFGAVLKEGLAEDAANQKRVAELLRFNSTGSSGAEADRSLADYLTGFKEGQDKIYYLIADSRDKAVASPHLEAFRDREVEVLLLTDRIDEWALQYLTEYEGKSLKDVTRGSLDLPGEEGGAKVEVEPDKDQKDLLKRIKRSLRDQVNEVRASTRLKESAGCIVLNEDDLGYQMRELLKAAGQEAPESKPNLELNLSHPLLMRLADEADSERFDKLSSLVLDQAVLAEGRQLADPAGFVRRLNEVLFDA